MLGKLFPPRDLWAAAKRGDRDAIRRLTEAGADVDAKKRSLNIEGARPLHIAAGAGQAEAIKELVGRGAKVDAGDDGRKTPLMYGVNGRRNHEVIDTLVDLGADINRQDSLGFTALDWAAFQGDEGMVALLLRRGADPNVKRRDEPSAPVACSVEGRNLAVLKLLIAAKADVNAQRASGSALQKAAMDGRIDFLNLLVQAGADLNLSNSSGFTPLMAAVCGRRWQAVELLLKAGAAPNLENDQGETALDLAYRERSSKIIAMLEAAGAKRGKRRT